VVALTVTGKVIGAAELATLEATELLALEAVLFELPLDAVELVEATELLEAGAGSSSSPQATKAKTRANAAIRTKNFFMRKLLITL